MILQCPVCCAVVLAKRMEFEPAAAVLAVVPCPECDVVEGRPQGVCPSEMYYLDNDCERVRIDAATFCGEEV